MKAWVGSVQSSVQSFAVGFLAALLMVAGASRADDVQAFRDYQAQALGSLREAYEQIRAQYPEDADLKAFQQRMETINELAVRILNQFETVKVHALKKALSGTLDAPMPPEQKVIQLSAAELISEYREQFSRPLPVPKIDSSSLPVLKEYYNKTIQAVMDYIAPRGCSAAIVSKNSAADVFALALVIHFLHVPDARWDKGCIERLPDLMKKPSTLESLEEICLNMSRPRTAYQFYLYRIGGEKFDPAFFLQKAERLSARNEWMNAVQLLKAGLEIAGESDGKETAAPLSVRLAEIYYTLGHLELAIDTMEEVLRQNADSDYYCRAAALQLKYLYEEGRCREAADKALFYLDKNACEIYQPEIMYIAWLAARRSNRMDEAEKLKKAFLEKYPQNHLGANMLFDSAINALANTNYRQAREILEQIEYHYPGAKILSKVGELKERLSRTE